MGRPDLYRRRIMERIVSVLGNGRKDRFLDFIRRKSVQAILGVLGLGLAGLFLYLDPVICALFRVENPGESGFCTVLYPVVLAIGGWLLGISFILYLIMWVYLVALAFRPTA